MLPNDFRFADPWALTLLLMVPALFVVYVRRRTSVLRGGVALPTLAPLAGITPSLRLRLRPLLAGLRLLAIAVLIVGLARPQSVEANARVVSEGIDIVLALDISGSMGEPGLGAATKLQAAKQALTQFLKSRQDDRVGFVVFKSESRVMSPLTTDYQALILEVDQADRLNQFLSEGTAIGLGLADALSLLRNSPARSRVVILATDGENNQHQVEPEQAGAIAAALKMRVYTIGIPTAGQRAELSLDEQQMRRIAEGTGGSYTRAANAEGLAATFASIATLEKSRVERERFTRYREWAPWFLAVAFGLVVAELLLGATIFRRAP